VWVNSDNTPLLDSHKLVPRIHADNIEDTPAIIDTTPQ
jgi:hypothetical protein